MKRTSDLTNDGGNIVAGIAILALMAAIALIACGCYALALSRYAESERSAFLACIEANNEIH